MTEPLPMKFELFVHRILDPGKTDEHIAVLHDYMDGGDYTGASFSTLTAGTTASASAVDTGDLAALWTLSVPLRGKQAFALLHTHAEQLTQHLTVLQDEPLASLSRQQINAMHDEASPAMELWNLVRGIKGMGPTRTSKILARKRPHLIPIYDSFVKSVLGLGSSERQWHQFHEAFSREERKLERKLLELGREAGHPELSALRVFDILVWMAGDAQKRAKKGQK